MPTFLYVPVDSQDLLDEFATPMAAGMSARILRVVDRGISKAFRRIFSEHLSRLTASDLLYVIMHGTGDYRTASTHGAGQRTDDGRTIVRQAIGEATGSRAALLYYRCATCTRIDREEGPCERCNIATVPWRNPPNPVYWCETHKTTSAREQVCRYCTEEYQDRVARTPVRRGYIPPVRPGVMTELPQNRLAVYHKLYTPDYLARNLEKEGLTKRIRDVRIFSCGSGTEVGNQRSYAERLYWAMRARGYGTIQVTGYRGTVTVRKDQGHVGQLLITPDAAHSDVPIAPRHLARFGVH